MYVPLHPYFSNLVIVYAVVPNDCFIFNFYVVLSNFNTVCYTSDSPHFFYI